MGPSWISRLIVLMLVADVVCTAVTLWAASVMRSRIPLGLGGALPTEATSLPWYVYLIAVVAWSAGLNLADAYEPERVLRWHHEALRVGWGGLLAATLMAGGLYFAFRDMSRLQFVYFTGVNLSALVLYRLILRVMHRYASRRQEGGHRRILILGAGTLGLRLAELLSQHARWGLELVGFLDDDPAKLGQTFEGGRVFADLEALEQVVQAQRVEELWIALPPRASDRIARIVTLAERLPVRIKVAPDYFSMALVRAKAEILGGFPLIGLREPVIEGANRLVKRIFDLLVSGASLLVAALPMAVIAACIRLDSPGPVLFRQQRVGENGRLFDMLKFRTMVADAESRQALVVRQDANGQVIHKHKDDPRITRLGRWLRRYSLDELPQLFNVLRGDMSLVGPRPELPWLVDRYESWQRKRFAVPQGITGWWQVNGRSDKPMHLNTEDDLYYVYNYSLWLDLRILLMTPVAALRGRGAF